MGLGLLQRMMRMLGTGRRDDPDDRASCRSEPRAAHIPSGDSAETIERLRRVRCATRHRLADRRRDGRGARAGAPARGAAATRTGAGPCSRWPTSRAGRAATPRSSSRSPWSACRSPPATDPPHFAAGAVAPPPAPPPSPQPPSSRASHDRLLAPARLEAARRRRTAGPSATSIPPGSSCSHPCWRRTCASSIRRPERS